MAVTYYALLTTIGAGKLANATALGTTLKITQLAVGDGGGNVPTPDASRTQLVNEVRRAPLNRLSVDPANSAQIIAEQVIPEDVGGWWIREMGLYDEAGALIAYANCAPSYKPQLAEGSGRTQTVRIVLIVSNASSVELKIDPSVVLATREYVDNSIVTAINRLDCKQSVRLATTGSITLSGLQTLDGTALLAGDRVLVKNQSNAAENGIYVAAATAWKRSNDADESSEVSPGLTVSVESGISQADSIWQLVTDGAIVLGTTALTFQNITNGLARLASPAFTGVPTAPTAAQGTGSGQIATTEFVKNSGFTFGNFVPITASRTLTINDVGKWLYVSGSTSISLVLPVAASVMAGSTITLYSVSAVDTAISAASGEGLNISNSPTQIILKPGENLTLASVAGSWSPVSGTASIKGASSFRSSLASNGYQVLPSGLIIQWGANITASGAASGNFSFTTPFPSACLQVFASDSGNSCIPVGVSAISNSQFVLYRAGKVYTSSGDLVVPGVIAFRWFAIGI